MNTKTLIGGMVLTFVFALPVQADNVRGVITKIDLDKKEVLVETRGLRQRGEFVLVFLTADTEIRLGLKAGQTADLATGRRVNVQFDLRDGKRLASRITVNGLGEATPDATPAAPADPNSVRGTLRRIDFTEREIVIIRTGDREETFPVPEDVVVTKDQKAIRFDDLKEGQQIVVKFEMQDGKRVAKSIQVGGVAAVGLEGRERPIQKVREILKMVDELLQRAEQRRGEKP